MKILKNVKKWKRSRQENCSSVFVSYDREYQRNENSVNRLPEFRSSFPCFQLSIGRLATKPRAAGSRQSSWKFKPAIKSRALWNGDGFYFSLWRKSSQTIAILLQERKKNFYFYAAMIIWIKQASMLKIFIFKKKKTFMKKRSEERNSECSPENQKNPLWESFAPWAESRHMFFSLLR